MLATQYAEYYKITPQTEKESDYNFRHRVAGELRDMGKIIEAHEAQQDERYENSDSVMAGVAGALAQALQGVDYGVSGVQQVGCDIAAGGIALNPKKELSPEMLLMACLMAK